ncbi:hypothetical protein [Dyadobacter pollutisoli]|uniref:Uncharacterized protein n=1 Tax=Dyadobacter pollutisoli TaxID=2910158 RepID=A0A9E8N9H4_9BACT|nr:hypothetical protein [Dyadobacter pollutisoli]WAC12430.1 hypothetical protein ON006_00420 [Dyadobacter pollutisoli]
MNHGRVNKAVGAVALVLSLVYDLSLGSEKLNFTLFDGIMRKFFVFVCALAFLGCSEKIVERPDSASPMLRASLDGKNNFVYVVDGKEMKVRDIHPALDHYIVKYTLVTNDEKLRAKYNGRANVGVAIITTNRKL